MKIQFHVMIALGAFAIATTGRAQETPGRIVGSGGVTVEARFTEISEQTLRISLLPIHADGSVDEIPATDFLQPLTPVAPVQTLRTPGKPVAIGAWTISVSIEPLTFHVEKAGRLVQEIGFDAQGAMTFSIGDSPVLGLGEGAQQFDRRGGNFPEENGQQTGNMRLTGARVAAPFLIGTKGWALFCNTPRGAFDLHGERGIVRPENGAPSGIADIFVMDARQPEVAMREFVHLLGHPALPPRWALGYMQSHRTLASTEEMLNIADTFRAKKLPCDALIYLGTGFCPQGWNQGHDSIEFNPKLFTRPPSAVLGELHEKNFKVVLHVVPPMDPAHEMLSAFAGDTVNPGKIRQYWKRHLTAFTAGADGWWPDEGDGLNLAQRMARHRMYYDGPLSARPNERPWSLHRNGFPGIGRYGGWVWSGDVAGKWATLAAQVPVGINTSLSLTPYWGTDTGGFINSEESTGELFVRWFQFSTFNPSFRSHGRAWHTRLPWGWNTGDPGVMEGEKFPLPETLHNPDVEPICRDYLNLRYRLLSYNYTLAREAYDTGMPLIRALWLHYPDDAAAAKRGDEFLWGRNLLVAPVVTAGATERRVYLPAGDWYDWWTAEKLTGGREITRPVDLKTMPLYVRAGTIMPLDPVRQFTSEPVSAPTTLQVYRGADGDYTLYDDDGHSLAYQDDMATWIRCRWHDADSRLEISLDARTRQAAPVRTFEVLLLPDGIRKTATFTGQKIILPFTSVK
ncbi:MAG: TIM-barrel domain-containing protein [Luteolibacter sp.]